MEHALPVGGRKGIGNLRRHVHRVAERQWSVRQPFRECLPREVLHHEERNGLTRSAGRVLADVVEPADVRVIEGG